MAPHENRLKHRDFLRNLAAGAVARGLVVVVSVLLLSAVAWYLLPKFSWTSQKIEAEMHQVQRGRFIHEITARGNLDSPDNVDVKCGVHSRFNGRQWFGTMILWVIPEGTHVEPAPDWKPDPNKPDEEPPDLLFKLDDSLVKNQRIERQIECNTRKAELIQARKNLESARNSLEEYVEGTHKIEKQTIENRIFDTEAAYRRAQQNLEKG